MAPARASMTAAAPRLSHLTGSTFSRLRPPMMARPAATHRAATAPTPTDSGSWYLAARLALMISVKMAKLGDEDHRETGRGDGQERPPRVMVLNVLVTAGGLLAQQEDRADDEQHGHDDLRRCVRQQAQQAAGDHRQRGLDGERGSCAGEHVPGPETAAQHEASDDRLVGQLGRQDDEERRDDDG